MPTEGLTEQINDQAEKEIAAEEKKWSFYIAISTALIAVLAAISSLVAGHHSNEALIEQIRASDQWAFYQAKNIRMHEMQSMVDLLGAITPQDKEKTATLREKYVKEVERYGNDKENISEKAKELEKERDLLSRRADRFDGGEALLEIGLVICSITLLTKRRGFWIGSILVGAAGVVLAVTGFLVH